MDELSQSSQSSNALTPRRKKRRPLLAGLLALLTPVGTAQLYNGSGRKAVGFIILVIVFVAALRPSKMLHSFGGLATFTAITIGFTVFLVIDAVGEARRKGEMELKWYNRLYVYIIPFLVAVIIPNRWIKSRVLGMESFRIPAPSMAPALQVGDYMQVDLTYYRTRPPSRGDIAVFTLDENPDIHIVKRIIGLPGDTVQHSGTQILINSVPSPEWYARYEQRGIPERNFGPVTVPDGHLFLTGDNRDRSKDSQFSHAI